MDIVVLAGGLSTERDVSFVTGSMVADALKKNGHRVILLDVFMGYHESEEDVSDIFSRAEEVSLKVSGIPEIAPDIEQVKKSRKDQSACFFGPNVITICRMADMVFMALHGENGENGKIQAVFDLYGIRYTGSGYFESAVCMNKNIAKLFFREAGVPCPQGIFMKKSQRLDCFSDTGLSLPCVVKPNCGGSSVGVSIVRDESEYEKALDEAFSYEDEILIEEYVEGREFSVGVMEGKALPIIEIAPIEGFYDYKNKYKAGSAVETCPADLPQEITRQMQQYAEAAAAKIGLNSYSRIDFLMNRDQKIYCLEANTLPGMTPTSLLPQEAAAVGIDFAELCQKIVDLSMKKYQEKA